MDNSDLAAAALRENKIGKCNCSRHTKLGKPHPACKKCKGTGKVQACEDCDGSGWSAKNNKPCARCEGRGYL